MSTNRRSPQNRPRAPQTEQAAPVTVSTHPQPEEPKLPLERIGDMLKRVRTERGDDLQQIADYLCIRKGFLVALENNRYDEFPADAYVIGFLRSYAEYLGVNSKEAIDRYRNEMAGRRKKPALLIPAPITEGRTPSGAIMAGTAVAAFLVYALWYGFSSSDRSTVTTPPELPTAAAPAETTPAATTEAIATAPTPAPASQSETPAPTPTTTSITPTTVTTTPLPPSVPANDTPAGIALQGPAPAAQMPMAPAAPAPMPIATTTSSESAPIATPPLPPAATTPAPSKDALPDHLTIRATQSTWVLVTDSKGHPVYDHVMKPGEVYKVPRNPNLVLTTGNGSGIVLSLDGRDLPRLSMGSSHVVRNVPLDDQSLRSLPANPDD